MYSNPTGVVSGSSAALESYEPTFQQDLNHDGIIGAPHVSAAAGASDGGVLTLAGATTFTMYAASMVSSTVGEGPTATVTSQSVEPDSLVKPHA
jgi:serralysin